MARRTPGSDSPAPVEESTPTTSEKEAAVTTTATETPTEAASDEKPEKAKVEVDLTAFEEAVQTAVGMKDDTTGDVPEASIAPVVQAYRDLDGLVAKNAAKKHLNGLMREAMDQMDLPLARAYFLLSDNLSAGPAAAKAERVPADPTAAFVQRAASLRLALNLVVADKGEGVADDAEEKVKALVAEVASQMDTYKAYLKDEAEDKTEPEVNPVVKAAFKLASGRGAGRVTKSGTGYTGERRDIGEHIRQAFADVDTGTFLTIAEIRNKKSTEYGDNPPSAGAISARLFPGEGKKCTVPGVEPGTNEKSHRGARKV